MTKCKSCGADIYFIPMLSGRLMPVNTQKMTIRKDGGHDVLVTVGGELIRGTLASPEDGANAEGYLSHFATCPAAGDHRRR